MRYVNLLVAAVFTWSAVIQYNDPDPWLWIAVYLGAAVIAFMASFRRFYLPAIMALGLICILWMMTLTGGVADFLAQGDPGLIATGMSPERPYVELTREFGGLGLILVSCIAYGLLARRTKTAAGV